MYANPDDESSNFATVADVETAYQTLDTEAKVTVQALLRKASNLVRSKAPRVDDDIAAGQLSAVIVGDIVTDMVVRVLRNPKGMRQYATGPFSGTYDIKVAAGYLYVSEDELAQLRPHRRGRRRIGTISVRATL